MKQINQKEVGLVVVTMGGGAVDFLNQLTG
jgi:hypothetical protein